MDKTGEALLKNLKSPKEDKKNEIILYDSLISNFTQKEEFNSDLYGEIIVLIVETRLSPKEPIDYMYIWKAAQAVRILTRNPKIQNCMFSETHLKVYSELLNALCHTQPLSKIISRIISELISIINRYLYSEAKVEQNVKSRFLNLIIDDEKLMKNMIFLLQSDDTILLKSLRSSFKIFAGIQFCLDSYFSELPTVKSIIVILQKIEEKTDKDTIDIVKIILDVTLYVMNNVDFLLLFNFLGGKNALLSVIRAHKFIDEETIKKPLHLLQKLLKLEFSISNDFDQKVMDSIFNILFESDDFAFNKIILKNILSLAYNYELSLMLQVNFIQKLFQYVASTAMRSKNNELKAEIILENEIIVIKLLRLIFCLEKNRQYYKKLLPTNLFTTFIQIEAGGKAITKTEDFIKYLNNLPQEDLEQINQNSIHFTSISQAEKKVIGRYEIMEMIGKGGFGSVYKVKKNNNFYAMKCVKLEQSQIKYIKAHPQNIEDAINEIKIWKRLHHPNIIKYHSSFIENGVIFIIMELIDGLSLGEYIANLKEKSTPISKEVAMNIILQIMNGIREMHKNGIIYRDLNPNNVMLDKAFNVKLIDFGLTVEIGKEDDCSLTQSVSPMFEGSIFYSAPEILNGNRITCACDMWALGSIVYEMFLLKVPFEGDNPLTIAKNVCELNYEKLTKKQFGEEIYELVTRCLVIDTSKRIDIDSLCDIFGKVMFERMVIEKENMELMKKANNITKKIINNNI